MPTAGEFSRRSQNDVDISDFENIDAASSDDETLINGQFQRHSRYILKKN